MSELKLQKLLAMVTNLKAEEAWERLPISKAAGNLIAFTKTTPEPLIQQDKPEFKDNPFIKNPSKAGCSII